MTFAKKLNIARVFALVAYFGLIGVFIVKSFVLGPENAALSTKVAVFLLTSVPLLIFLPGLLKDKDRSHTWVCFVILGYFTYSIMRLSNLDSAQLIDWIYCALTVVSFCASMMFIRYKKRVLAGL